ncbi:MAG: 30S ribosomal protein S20, partial [Nitrospinota bacterium]
LAKVHKSVVKRVKQDKRRQDRNVSYKSRIASVTKKVLELAGAGDKEKALAEFKKAQAIIDSAANKGILHKNTVARRVARLGRSVAKISAK